MKRIEDLKNKLLEYGYSEIDIYYEMLKYEEEIIGIVFVNMKVNDIYIQTFYHAFETLDFFNEKPSYSGRNIYDKFTRSTTGISTGYMKVTAEFKPTKEEIEEYEKYHII